MVSSPLPELISPVGSAKHFVSSTEFIIAFIAFIAFTKERETSIDSMLAGLLPALRLKTDKMKKCHGSPLGTEYHYEFVNPLQQAV